MALSWPAPELTLNHLRVPSGHPSPGGRVRTWDTSQGCPKTWQRSLALHTPGSGMGKKWSVNWYHLPTGPLWLPGLVASGTRCSAGVWKHSAPAGEGGLTT